MKFVKKVIAGLLVVAVVITGVIVAPKTVQAAEDTLDSGVKYILDEENYKFSNYWSSTKSERKAPVKPGFVFGGWYQKTGGSYVALKETNLTAEGAETPTEVYAKFVPDYVLSIKAQNQYGTEKVEGTESVMRSVRIISSVDSRSYQNVGFDIWLNNKKQLEGCVAEDVYLGLLTGSGENEQPQYANQVFGNASSHFSVWRLDNINSANDGKIIYARPYWTTLDGTKVEGLAKYVHIEDEYEEYVSVPVNLTSGEDIAAGKIKFTYNSEVLTFVSFEAGRVLNAMTDNHATAGSVNMVGNITADSEGMLDDVSADGIYANLRFKVNDGKDESNKDLQMTEKSFCNLAEELYDAEEVDVVY